MPNIRKLAPEEVRTIERKSIGLRRSIEREYDAFLRDFVPGEYGEALLDPDDKRNTVRTRLKAAAARRNPPYRLIFPRTRNADVVRFFVAEELPAREEAQPPRATEHETREPVAETPVASDAPPARKRGRPRKNAQSAPPAEEVETSNTGRRRAGASATTVPADNGAIKPRKRARKTAESA
jgi:hypothetical protein